MTVKYLPTWIKTLARLRPPRDGTTSTTAVARTDQNSPDNDRDSRSGDDKHQPETRSEIQPQCRLLQLPTEILLDIRSYLAPLDILLLALTCRYFRQWCTETRPKEWFMVELHSTSAEVHARRADWLQYRKLFRKDQCYAFLENQAMGLAPFNMSVCGGCFEVHKNRMFSFDQLNNPSHFDRLCLARATPLTVCSHVQFFYHELEAFVNRPDTEHGHYSDCLCRRHHRDIVIYDFSRVSISTAGQRLDKSNRRQDAEFQTHYSLEFHVGYFPVEGQHIRLADEDGQWQLCNHVTLKDALRLLKWDKERSYSKVACKKCFTTFSSLGPAYPKVNDKASVSASRCLGYGGHVPDKWWRAAVGLE